MPVNMFTTVSYTFEQLGEWQIRCFFLVVPSGLTAFELTPLVQFGQVHLHLVRFCGGGSQVGDVGESG